MNKKLIPLACAGFLLTLAVLALPGFYKGQVRGADESSEKYLKLFNQGNYKEAFEGFKKLALEPNAEGKNAATNMNMALQSLRNLQQEKRQLHSQDYLTQHLMPR